MLFKSFPLLIISLISSATFAKSSALKIYDSARFFSASGRTFIQGGQLVDIRYLDQSKTSCSTKGVGVSTVEPITGDLSFSKEVNSYGTLLFKGKFEYYGNLGEMLFLHCSNQSKELTQEDINLAINSMAELN